MINLPIDQLGIQGTVEKVIGPGPLRRGQIRFQGGWWTAQCERPNVVLEPGQFCRVIGRDRITLVVEPCSSLT
ncbi:MAG: hypothetical protein F6J87_14270 [Spirulina sp. SIO3F2]|nr:hypothetical protein [Spirulina sp. SIO3F2]